MSEKLYSRLLWMLADSVGGQMPEEEAVRWFGVTAVMDARVAGLVDTDDGSFWDIDPILYLTKRGRTEARRGRMRPRTRRSAYVIERVRAALVPGRTARLSR